MMKGRSLLRWAGLLVAVALVSVWGHEARSSKAEVSSAGSYADIVTIDVIGKMGNTELPAVTYRHDLHTEAMKKLNKDCSACHKTQDGKMSLKFMRTEDGSAEELKKLYHTNCFACHAEQAAAGNNTGPQEGECRACHNPNPADASAWKEVGMDKSLHYRHISAKTIKVAGQDVNCGACHHVYDPATKKAEWKKNTEDSCRACHKSEPTPVAEGADKMKPAFKVAAHESCVLCHVKTTGDTGPVTCAGCHTAEAQKQYKVVTEVPRLERGQPDATLVVADDLKKAKLPAVAFNHKLHEASLDNCRTCHHEKIASCTECHTVAGKKEGNFVQLEQAMHAVKSKTSCVGCHNTAKTDPSCAGCHSLMPKAAPSEQSCATCHEKNAPKGDELAAMDKDQKLAAASALVSARPTTMPVYGDEDIPEFVEIGAIADKYEPSKMPHRKIVKTMIAAVDGNKMAASFHTDPGTFCQGCHHNSPVSKTPPKCQSCHGKPFEADKGDRPGLKAAYHQQCMGCHAAMKLEKPKATACKECHAERTN